MHIIEAMVTVLAMSVIGSLPQQVQPLVSGVDASLVEIDTIDQVYFSDVVFLQIDTGGTFSTNPPTGYAPIRVAIDDEGRLYELYNCDSVQFNDIVARYSVSLGPDQADGYGRFYIETVMNYSFYPYHYITDIHAFIELNRELMLGSTVLQLKKKFAKVEREIAEVCKDLNFDSIIYDKKTGSYIVDYYIWYQASGRFRHIQLSIEADGDCTVLADELLSDEIGFPSIN